MVDAYAHAPSAHCTFPFLNNIIQYHYLYHCSELRRLNFSRNKWDNIDPTVSSWLHTHRVRCRATTTLSGYMTYVRRFVQFCNLYKFPVRQASWHPKFMCYWLTWMVKVVYKDSIQSIRSWEAAVTWLALCVNEIDNKAWYQHTLYRSLRKQLLRDYQLPPCEKYPFTIQQLATYTAHRKCFPGRYRKIPYDTLLEVTWIQLLFMTMSRPCEMLNLPCDANKFGLRLKDIVRITHFEYAYFDLAVWHFKNDDAHPNRSLSVACSAIANNASASLSIPIVCCVNVYIVAKQCSHSYAPNLNATISRCIATVCSLSAQAAIA